MVTCPFATRSRMRFALGSQLLRYMPFGNRVTLPPVASTTSSMRSTQLAHVPSSMVSATLRPALAGPSVITLPGPGTGGRMRWGDSTTA